MVLVGPLPSNFPSYSPLSMIGRSHCVHVLVRGKRCVSLSLLPRKNPVPQYRSTSIASPSFPPSVMPPLFSLLTHATNSSITDGQLLSSLQNPKDASRSVSRANVSVCRHKSLLTAFVVCVESRNSNHHSRHAAPSPVCGEEGGVSHSSPGVVNNMRQNSTAISFGTVLAPGASISWKVCVYTFLNVTASACNAARRWRMQFRIRGSKAAVSVALRPATSQPSMKVLRATRPSEGDWTISLNIKAPRSSRGICRSLSRAEVPAMSRSSGSCRGLSRYLSKRAERAARVAEEGVGLLK